MHFTVGYMTTTVRESGSTTSFDSGKTCHLAVKHDFTTVLNSGTTTLNSGKSTATSIIG